MKILSYNQILVVAILLLVVPFGASADSATVRTEVSVTSSSGSNSPNQSVSTGESTARSSVTTTVTTNGSTTVKTYKEEVTSGSNASSSVSVTVINGSTSIETSPNLSQKPMRQWWDSEMWRELVQSLEALLIRFEYEQN